MPPFDRREFLRRSRTGALLAVSAVAAPTLMAACSRDEPVAGLPSDPPSTASPTPPAPTPDDAGSPTPRATPLGTAIVADVVDFALESDQWAGAFGFATFRLHQGVVEGEDVYFIRTDTSDKAYADSQGLVHVPKLAPLIGDGLSHTMYLFEEPGQPAVMAVEPGMDGYSPAWRLQRARFTDAAVELRSVAEVTAAIEAGAVVADGSPILLNAPIVKWSAGELAVDDELTAYHGNGHLISAPDVDALRVTFKLNQCYPGSWYIVTDHSFDGAAQATNTIFAPGLQDGATAAGATARTNVFLNGIEGPGPFGFQPSLFDFPAGAPEWSPYWDHFAYRWSGASTPRLLTTQDELFAARDAGELEEFIGVPDTDGMGFTVNCPVPVLGENTYRA